MDGATSGRTVARSPPFVAIAIFVCVAAGAPKATRINRAIELLEQGQPIYYTGSHEGTDGSFEQGVKDAQTWADYISYDMEHAPYDVKGLADYMRGLAKGGPTKSGHRTPAVIVNVPVNGTDEATVRANAWMFSRCWRPASTACCCATRTRRAPSGRSWKPFDSPPYGGRRGVHGNSTAAQIWGVSADEYAEKADAWPLNPNGELLLGLKLEDKYALANADANIKVPGIGFAEWGPGDMALSLGVKNGPGPMPAAMQAARQRVFAATKANKIFFLNSMNADNVVDMIKEGVMIGSADQRAAEIGRRHTKREMPW